MQYPAWYTKSLSGTEDFPSAADGLLKLTDAVWCTPESPIPGSIALDEWQNWLLRHVLEEYPAGHPMAGQLRYREVLISVGRQNGKSVLGAILAVWGLLREPGAIVIGVAHSVDQARVIYNRTKFTTEAVPQLAKRFTRSSVTRGLETTTKSVYELKASKSGAVQGIPVSVGLIDELHITDSEVWNGLTNGTTARENGIVIGITTAGDSGSELLLRLYETAREAVEETDSRFGAFVWEAPEARIPEDDDTLIEYLKMANPSLAEGRLSMDTALFKVRKAPAFDAIRYRLNRFVESANSWLPPGGWAPSGGAVSLAEAAEITWGVDLSNDNSYGSIVGTWKDDDGSIYTALVASLVEPRHDDVVSMCRSLARLSPSFALENTAGNRRLIEALASYRPTVLNRADACAAAAVLYRVLQRHTLTHNQDQILAKQVHAAQAKNVGAEWRFTRGADKEPIDALSATAASVFAIETDRHPKFQTVFG